MKKIFAPDLMFNDFVSAGWCTNIETRNGRIPIQKELKNSGIFAVEITPKTEKTYSAFGFPVNKNWKPEDLSNLKNPKLTFEVASARKTNLRIQFQNPKDEAQVVTIELEEYDDWESKTVDIPQEAIKDLRLIVFAVPAIQGNTILMKNVKIIE
jgi:hypothetical protein